MPIVVSNYDQLVYITSPTTSASVQAIYDACMEAGDSMEGTSFHFDLQPGHSIVDSVGKFDVGGGFLSGIIMTLAPEWQIQYWNGVGYGVISGGNIVGGVGGDPIKPTGGSDTVKLLGDIGGVIVQTGGEFTEPQKTALLTVHGIDAGGAIGIPTDGALKELLDLDERIVGLNFENTLRWDRVYSGDDIMAEKLSLYDGSPVSTATEIHRYQITYTYAASKVSTMQVEKVAVP